MIVIKIVASVILFFLTSLIGAYDYRLEAIIAEIIYSIILLKISKSNKNQDYLILLSPIILIEGLTRVLNYEDTFFSLPPFIFKLIPFIIFLIFRENKNMKTAFLINIILTTILNIFFYSNWLNYVNEGTLTGKIKAEKVGIFNLLSYNQASDTIKINESSGIKIIDFWTESCGICYKAFPKFSEIKNDYAANKNITFITALNSKKDNFREIAHRIDSTYNLNTFIVSDKDCKKLKIDGYPTIIIFNNNTMIFRGSAETLDSFMKSEDFQNLIQL